MTRHTLLIIERKSELLPRIGLSRSNLHNKIQLGLWCPPISLGERAVGYIKYESDEVLSAYINGFTPEEIKELVQKLVSERRDLLEVSHG